MVPTHIGVQISRIYTGVRGISQKGHNGACSQIGVQRTRPREGWGKARGGGRVARGGCRDINGGEERDQRGLFPLIQNASAPLCCPGALLRPLILAKRQPFCT